MNLWQALTEEYYGEGNKTLAFLHRLTFYLKHKKLFKEEPDENDKL